MRRFAKFTNNIHFVLPKKTTMLINHPRTTAGNFPREIASTVLQILARGQLNYTNFLDANLGTLVQTEVDIKSSSHFLKHQKLGHKKSHGVRRIKNSSAYSLIVNCIANISFKFKTNNYE